MSWRQGTSPMRDEVATSRAINLNLAEAQVRADCAKHGLAISAIETLLSGGTRVVMMNGDDAVTLRKVLKTKLLTEPVQRSAFAARR